VCARYGRLSDDELAGLGRTEHAPALAKQILDASAVVICGSNYGY